MGITLDEYLAEVDRWKQGASDEVAALSVTQRTQRGREARAWLEAKLGHPLQKAAQKGNEAASPLAGK